MLSQHSFNALLKTLEEPPEHVKFIFATTDPHKVLPTVVSRCQRYDLRRIGLGELRAHLKKTVEAEGIKLSDESLALVAREAEGSLRDAQSLLEQVLAVAGSAADDATVREVLGAADRRLVIEVADAALAGDPAAALRRLAELHAYGYDAQRFCRDLLEHSSAVQRATGEALPAVLPEAEVEAIARQAGRLRRRPAAFLPAARSGRDALAPARTVDPEARPRNDGRVSRRCRHCCRSTTFCSAWASRGKMVAASTPRPASRVTASTTGPAPTANGGDPWDRFLTRVREDRCRLHAARGRQAVSTEGDLLRIGVENEAMRRGLEGALQRLKSIARVSGRDLRVSRPLPEEHAATHRRAGPTADRGIARRPDGTGAGSRLRRRSAQRPRPAEPLGGRRRWASAWAICFRRGELKDKCTAPRTSWRRGQSKQVPAGVVTAVVNGRFELVSIRIEPSLVASPDLEMLQDLVVAAVNAGVRSARRMIEEEMSKLTGGLGIKLPGMP
jgi:DNA-binding protein YbaB